MLTEWDKLGKQIFCFKFLFETELSKRKNKDLLRRQKDLIK